MNSSVPARISAYYSQLLMEELHRQAYQARLDELMEDKETPFIQSEEQDVLL
jgi:hypothetical protein